MSATETSIRCLGIEVDDALELAARHRGQRSAVPPNLEKPPGPPTPSGIVTRDPGMFKTYGGTLDGLTDRKETPEQLQQIKDAAARANRSKRSLGLALA